MIRLAVNTILLTLLLLLPSCEKYEWAKFESIKFEYYGIDLSSSDNGFTWQGNLPAEGTCFSIVPDEKHKDIASISYVEIDGIQQSRPSDFSGEPPYLEAIPILNGEWGAITYKSPHTIEFQINENNTDKPRVIKVTIGYGYTYADLVLTQAPRAK